MIEQNNNQLTLTFPTTESATTFAAFLRSLFNQSPPESVTSEPLSGPSQATPDSPEPGRSRHVVLTPERQEQLFNQRQQGMTAHQRVQRAQTTLRDGTLPFRAMHEPPQPSGQPSPRQKAQAEGGFADGAVLPAAKRKRSKLRPSLKPSQS